MWTIHMMITVFTDYKKALAELLKSHSSIPALKSRAAKAAGIQASYLSQVLHGNSQLTPDHALGLADFFKLSNTETEYFLELVNLERASTPALRKHLNQKLQSLSAASRKSLAQVVERPQSDLSPEFFAFYYGSWVPSALHIAVSIPSLQTENALHEHFRIPHTRIRETLSLLEKQGLVAFTGKKWSLVDTQFHLGKNSPWLRLHAQNWRDRALERLQDPEVLAYTDVCSMSRSDATKLQERWMQDIKNFRRSVQSSKEETLYCLNLDFFRVMEE